MNARESIVDLDDVRLFIRDVGQGDALVLAHGGPGMSHAYMRPLEALASEQLRVISYDQRGSGASSFPDPPRFHLRDHVGDLDAIRSHVGAQRIHLLGHSWGGLVCQAYAGKHPRRVASLTLVGTMAPCWEDNRAGQLELRERMQELTDLGVIPDPLPAVEGDSCKASSLAMVPAYLGDPEMPLPPALEQTSFSVRGFHASVDRLGRYDLRQKLLDVAVPTTIFVGHLDPFGIDVARAAARGLANAFPEIVVLPGIGHYPWLESEGFVEELRKLMARRLARAHEAG